MSELVYPKSRRGALRVNSGIEAGRTGTLEPWQRARIAEMDALRPRPRNVDIALAVGTSSRTVERNIRKAKGLTERLG